MWTCHKCNAVWNDDAKEFCFDCMTPRISENKSTEPSKSVGDAVKQPDLSVNSPTQVQKSYAQNPSNRSWSVLFLILSIITGFGGCIVSRDDARVVGGDAYNYIIGAGRGTAIVCVAIIFALISLTLAVYDLTNVIIYYNNSKE